MIGEAAPEESTGVPGIWPLPIFPSSPFAPFINCPTSSGDDEPPFTLFCELLEFFSRPLPSGNPVPFDFEGFDFVLFDCCLSLAEGILFFVRSVGLGPDGTSGRRLISVTAGLVLAGELELNVVRVDEVVVLDAVVLVDAAVVVLFTGAVLGVGAFLAAATVEVAVAGLVEARDVVVVTVDRDDAVVVIGRVVLGVVVLGETGVLLLGPLAGDVVRVSVLLADTLDAAVFLVSSTLGFATGVLGTMGLAVGDVDFVPKELTAVPVAFGLAADVLVARGDLVAVVVGVLVGVDLGGGFAVDADFAATLVPADEALEANEEPDAGLRLDKVLEPGVWTFEAVEDEFTLVPVVGSGLLGVALTLGFGDVADDPVGLLLDIPVDFAATGFVLRLCIGDDVAFSCKTFLSSFFLGCFTSSMGCGTLTSSAVTFPST